MASTKLPHLRHKYTTALRARRTAHRTRLLERQQLAQHRRWARGMLRAEMSLRSRWRADDRATARGILRTVKAEMPAYRRMARRGTVAEKKVVREALGILRGVRRRERGFGRMRGRDRVLDAVYRGFYPYSERVYYSRAGRWVRGVGERRRGMGFRWFEVLPWLREEYRRGGLERERERARVRRRRERARRRRDRRDEREIGRWMRRDVRRYNFFMRKQERERRERVRARKREFKRVRAKWGLGKRGRVKAMMRVGWRGFTTRVARFTSLPKKEPFTVLKKKVADSVSQLTSLPKKEPLTALKKKVSDSVTRLASLPKTPFTALKKKVADSVSRLTSLPKTPFTIFKKKKVVASDNDAQPRPPVVSEEPSEQEPSGSVEPLGGNAWADEDEEDEFREREMELTFA